MNKIFDLKLSFVIEKEGSEEIIQALFELNLLDMIIFQRKIIHKWKKFSRKNLEILGRFLEDIFFQKANSQEQRFSLF